MVGQGGNYRQKRDLGFDPRPNDSTSVGHTALDERKAHWSTLTWPDGESESRTAHPFVHHVAASLPISAFTYGSPDAHLLYRSLF